MQAQDAIKYAKFHGRSHDVVIRVYDEAGNVIEAHEHGGDFKAVSSLIASTSVRSNRFVDALAGLRCGTVRLDHLTAFDAAWSAGVNPSTRRLTEISWP